MLLHNLQGVPLPNYTEAREKRADIISLHAGWHWADAIRARHVPRSHGAGMLLHNLQEIHRSNYTEARKKGAEIISHHEGGWC
jgi:hypothetical protein